MPRKHDPTQTWLADLDSLSIEGRLEIRSKIANIRARMLRAAKAGTVDLSELADLEELLAGAIAKTNAISHMLGARRVLEQAQGRPVAFSGNDSLRDILEAQLNMDTDQLAATYQSEAFKVARGATATVERSIRKTLNDQVLGQRKPREAAAELRKAFDSVGLFNVQDNQLEALYSTQSAIAYQAGQWGAYKSPVVDEILWGFTYRTVGDDRVRPAHRNMNRTRLPKDDSFWRTNWAPNGWNCRCIIIPVFSKSSPRSPNAEDDVAPDPGFSFNPGEVFDAKPPAERVKDFTKASVPNVTTSARRGKPHAKLTRAQEATLRQVSQQDVGPITIETKDVKNLDRAAARTRTAKRLTLFGVSTVGALIGRGAMALPTVGQAIQPEQHHVVSSDPLNVYGDVVFIVKLRGGDNVIPMDEARAVLPRNAQYKVIKRRKRADGVVEITLTPLRE